MENLSKDVILDFNPDTLEAVRKLHGLDKLGDMAKAIDILDEWIKLQKYFVETDFDRDYLERTIIISKGSVERAKHRVGKMCTLRTLMPQFFGDYDVKVDFKGLDETFIYAAMPKMNKNHQRVLLLKAFGGRCDSQVFLDGYRNAAMILEHVKVHDYADSYIIVEDLREINVTDLVTKVSVPDLRQFITLLMDGYGFRIKAFHILSNSKAVDTFVSILKQVMSEKLGGRIKVHKTVETLYEFVPKEILPKECGGDYTSLFELHEKWNNILSSDEYRNHWRKMAAVKTDESLRQTDQFNDQYMGMPGTFRTLNVD